MLAQSLYEIPELELDSYIKLIGSHYKKAIVVHSLHFYLVY